MYLINIICFFLGSIFLIASSFSKNLTTKTNVENLIRQMTVSPNRQQEALDNLAKSGDEIIKYLPHYFNDKRKIADTNVKFLNTHPKAIEKYFMTSGTTVDEVIIQYFCFRTEKCIPTSDPIELKKIREHFPAN